MSSVAPSAGPRALLVSRNLPPLRGGMERLNEHLVHELSRDREVAVVGPRGCAGALRTAALVVELPSRPLWRFLLGALPAALRVARRFRPRLVIAGSGLTAPIAHLAARAIGARSAVYVHGLDLVVEHAVYRRAWLPFVRRCDLCLTNSRNTARLAREIGVRAERIEVVHPGADPPARAPTADETAAFRARHGLGDGPLLLSVGRLTERKGIVEFIRESFGAIVARHATATLAVIGGEPSDALVGASLGGAEAIRRAAREAGLDERVRLVGHCDDAALAAAYAAADLHVFPVRTLRGDVEGFGMVAIEAAAHGLPTVAFDAGGVADAVADGVSGRLVPADDHAALAAAILGMLDRDDREHVRAECRRFAEGFDWAHFGARLRAAIARVVADEGRAG